MVTRDIFRIFTMLEHVSTSVKIKVMSKKVKMLKKLIEEIKYNEERPTNDFMVGYNKGLDTAISLLNERIEYIERAK